MTPCMDVYKEKIQSDGSLDNLKLIVVVIRDLKNKELVQETLSPTASMGTLKYLMIDSDKHKAIVSQLDFIGAFLQAKVMNRVFLKLDSRYVDYFLDYSNYFGRAFRLFMSLQQAAIKLKSRLETVVWQPYSVR